MTQPSIGEVFGGDIGKTVDRVLEAAGKAIAAEVELNEIQEKLSHTGRKCGNCSLWMTSGCRPERESKKIRSMGMAACDLFAESTSSREFRVKWEGKLADFHARNK